VNAAYAFVLGLALATVLIPLLIRVAGPLGLTDRGGGRKVHTGLTPRSGGIAIVLGALTPVLLLVPMRADLRAYVIAATVLLVFGVLDDRFDLDFRLKLLGQIIAALIATLVGGMLIVRMPFPFDYIWISPIAFSFTVIYLVAITNAVNLSDGLDGLAGGVSLFAIGCLSILAYRANDIPTLTFGMAVIGATFGFLRFNTHPARLFMGDTGSQFLGFSAAVLAVIVTQRSDPALSPVVPLLILGLPILDTLTVMAGRLSRGQSPFVADRTHLHHRLLDAGLNQYEAVALIYAAQFTLTVFAYLLRYSPDWVLLATYLALSAAILISVRFLHGRRVSLRGRAERESALLRMVSRERRTHVISKAAFMTLSVAIPLILAVGAAIAPGIGLDVAILAAILLAMLISSLVFKPIPFFAIERLTAFVTAVTVVYFLNRDDWISDLCAPCAPAIFGTLALMIAIWLRFSSDRFKINTQDILILLIAAAIPSLPGLGLTHLGVVALESLVLFYGIELLVQEQDRRWDLLRVGLIAALVALSIRGFLF
jgi:UDP-GlcNAc:undecaprenyl-phosphate GlcNAc-1-phosphate transferase